GLVERAAAVLPVDLRRRRVEELLLQACRRGDHDVVAADVAQQAVDRLVDDQLDADRRRHVEADVDRLHALEDEFLVADGDLEELDLAGLERVLEVLEAARAQIVEDDDLVASTSKPIDQTGTDDAG